MGSMMSYCYGARKPNQVGNLPLDLIQQDSSGKVVPNWNRVAEHSLRCWASYREAGEIRLGRFTGFPTLNFFLNQSHRMVSEPGGLQVLYYVEVSADGVQWVTFRGTKNLENVKQDLTMTETTDSRIGIRIHSGVKKICDLLWDNVRPQLEKSKPVRLTGHSLGGGIACVIGARLVADGLKVEEIVTFGQLKVTDSAGAAQMAGIPLLRIVMDGDPIADSPPLPNYSHFGHELILRGGDAFEFRAPSDPRYADSVANLAGGGPIHFLKGLFKINNHTIASYSKNLVRKTRDLPVETREAVALFK